MLHVCLTVYLLKIEILSLWARFLSVVIYVSKSPLIAIEYCILLIFSFIRLITVHKCVLTYGQYAQSFSLFLKTAYTNSSRTNTTGNVHTSLRFAITKVRLSSSLTFSTTEDGNQNANALVNTVGS